MEPYKITKSSIDTWIVDGVNCTIDAALTRCEELDSLQGYQWDFPTAGECRDALEALKVGETTTVLYPDEEMD